MIPRKSSPGRMTMNARSDKRNAAGWPRRPGTATPALMMPGTYGKKKAWMTITQFARIASQTFTTLLSIASIAGCALIR